MNEHERVRVVICGTRTFTDAEFVYKKLDLLLSKLQEPIVCTGAARGVDTIAEDWANSRMHTIKRFHAYWNLHGDSAGPIRNKEMCVYAAERKPSFLIAFWDSKSKGTQNCIEVGKKLGLVVRVINIKGK